jgi:hypothetical protein
LTTVDHRANRTVAEAPVDGDARRGLSLTSLAVACALLLVAIAPAALLAALVGARSVFGDALLVAAVGGGVCWLAAALALASGWLGNRFSQPVPGVLGGVAFQMGLPLAALTLLPQMGGWFAAPALKTTILATYLVALTVQTVLAVRMIPRGGMRSDGCSIKASDCPAA